MIRVLVVASSPALRAGLEAIVREDARFTLVGEGARAGDTFRLTRQLHPDVLLMDIIEPGLTQLQPVMQGVASPAVVLLTTPFSRAELRRAYQNGVRAILPSDVGSAEISAAIESVANGLVVLTVEDLETLFPVLGVSLEEELAIGEPLTARETEVLSLLAEGAGNKEIATRLGISEHTVKFHVSSILAKLGAESRTEAVSRGFKEGLITI